MVQLQTDAFSLGRAPRTPRTLLFALGRAMQAAHFNPLCRTADCLSCSFLPFKFLFILWFFNMLTGTWPLHTSEMEITYFLLLI